MGVDELETAIEELIRNGIIHNERDRPTVELTVTTTDEWIEIQVADDSTGIPDEEYEPLESDEVTQLYHDTGYGLNLVYWITRRSGGRLRVAENSPRGSLVTIQLPTGSD